MIRWLVLAAWLTAVWTALWGEFSVANVLSGAVIAILILISFPFPRDPRHGAFRPVAAARFVAFFIWELASANAQVAWEVITPQNRENEGIISLPVVPSCSDTVLAMVVNSIGLTPGTMVIDLTEKPRVLYVHVLHLDDVEEARAALMRFQELAIRAFGSDRAIEELATLMTLRTREDR